ncbi:MAG: hypothetical protein ACUZ8O_00185 [Candidatus Anammoxibacter sp.]
MKRNSYRQTIPNPHGKDISTELIKEILRQADVFVNDWLAA